MERGTREKGERAHVTNLIAKAFLFRRGITLWKTDPFLAEAWCLGSDPKHIRKDFFRSDLRSGQTRCLDWSKTYDKGQTNPGGS